MSSTKYPLFIGGEEAWPQWAFQMRAFARLNKSGFVLDLASNPALSQAYMYDPSIEVEAAIHDAREAAAAARFQMQSNVFSWISLALQSEVDLNRIRLIDDMDPHCGTLAWAALTGFYANNGAARQMQLSAALHVKQMVGETLELFSNRILLVQSNMQAINMICTDQQVAAALIGGLLDQYAPMGQVILTTSPLGLHLPHILTTFKLTSELDLGRAAADPAGRSAFFSHGGGRGSGGKPPPAGFVKGTCYSCGQPGHISPNCPKKGSGAGPRPFRGAGGGGSRPPGFHCFVCGDKTHGANTCPKRYHGDGADGVDGGHSRVFMAVGDHATPSPYLPHSFVVDSGASEHITSVESDLYDYVPEPYPYLLKGLNERVLGHGKIAVQFRTSTGEMISGIMPNVAFVPGLGTKAAGVLRLYSQGLAQSYGLCFHYTSSGNYMQPANSPHQFPFRKMGNLYALDGTIRCQPVLFRKVSGPAPDLPCFLAAPPITRSLWHQRLGHLHSAGMTTTAAGVTGVTLPVNEPDEFCSTCAISKARVQNIDRTLSELPEAPFDLVGIDIWGPMTPSMGGFKYAFGAIDYNSSFAWTYFQKSTAEYLDNLPLLLGEAKIFDLRIRNLRMDNDPVFVSKAAYAAYADAGIAPQRAAPHSQFMNGKMERHFQTTSNMARSMLSFAELPNTYWVLAFDAAVYIRNRVWSTGAKGIPFELLTGVRPDLSHLRVFGCPAYVHTPASQQRKLSEKAWQGVFVGYCTDSPAWKVYNPVTRRVLHSRDVVFDETFGRPPLSPLPPPSVPPMGDCGDMLNSCVDPHVPAPDSIQRAVHFVEDLPAPHTNTTPIPSPTHTEPHSSSPLIPRNLGVEATFSIPAGFTWLKETDDVTCLLSAVSGEPGSYKEAMASPESALWQIAMDTEHASLIDLNVWEECELPPGRDAIGCRWVYKCKIGSDGSVVRYKARLVAKGFSQREGLDYGEVFAPVVKFTTLRTILALAATSGDSVFQMDVDTAFLYAPVDEDIYMRQPEGYIVGNPKTVLKLKKSLYGLKQSPRNWNLTLHNWLVADGFVQSTADPGLFIFADHCLLAIYVDDIIYSVTDDSWKEAFKARFEVDFKIKDLGEAAWVLGMGVTRDRSAGTITLHQSVYIQSLLVRFNMTDCKPHSSPSLVTPLPESPYLSEDIPYQSLVGSLLYAAVCTRPDIAESVGRLTRFMAQPTEALWVAAKRVLRYLSGTRDFGLTFGNIPDYVNGKDVYANIPYGYSDSDWAGDLPTRKSTGGYVFMLNGGPVSWKSQLQTCVALSTAEAEYMELSESAKEAMFLRYLLRDIQLTQTKPTVLLEDNQSAIALSNSAITNNRTKHIDIKYHFVREKVLTSDVRVEYCPTEFMLADVFTKPLAAPRHAMLCKAIMG